MLTKLIVRNFKRFEKVEIELGDPVVFIGPNNSGKTTALQALALWDVGLRRWNEKRKGVRSSDKRSGVTINRRDLISLPVPSSKLLWRDIHVRDTKIIGGKKDTKNIRIDIIVKGVTEGKEWKCGLEFDFANEESFYCRPLRLTDNKKPDRMPIPPEAEKVQIAFLPPMSGLASNETRLDPGAINVRVGEGRTAEVLRNICYKLFEENKENWEKVVNHIKHLFGADMEAPEYIPERGEVTMNYREKGNSLDLSSSGRGLQQTLLLIAYMYSNPGSVLLLDEPDAHLEILRQSQVYQLLTNISRENNNQIIAASHSEILLNEAAERDVVVAFVGKPHRIDDRGNQVLKALKDIGFEDYYRAEQTGWVLYLEGSTDLAILRAFADVLNHKKAKMVLEKPFVKYVGNQPSIVKKHFFGLRDAYQDLLGIAIFDRLDKKPTEELNHPSFRFETWKRKEIENYLCYPETSEAYAENSGRNESVGPLFAEGEAQKRVTIMRESIKYIENALQALDEGSPWDYETKVSYKFLTRIFENYFNKLNIPNLMAKKNFYELVYFVPFEKIDLEINEKLDAISEVYEKARPIC